MQASKQTATSSCTSPTAPPKITKAPESVSVKPGMTGLLDVQFASIEAAKVSWFVNGKPLTPDVTRVKAMSAQSFAKVNIMKAEPEDAGEYRVLIENKSGQVEHKVTVLVPKPPSKPTDVTVDHVTPSGVLVTWQVPAEGQPITEYEVEVEEGGNGKWQKVGKSVVPQLQVEQLKTAVELRLRVRAFNSTGASQHSDVSTVFVVPKKEEDKKPEEPKVEEKKPEEKKPEEKKPEEKKPEEKKPEEKKPEEKKPEEKKPEEKKPEEKKPEEKKPEEKKPDEKKPDEKKPEEEKKAEEKKPEEKKPEEKKPEEKKPEEKKPEEKKPEEEKKAEEKKPEEKKAEEKKPEEEKKAEENGFIKVLEDVVLEEASGAVVFTCEVAKEKMKADWFKNGKPLKASNRIKFVSAGKQHSLEVLGKKVPDDEAEYSVLFRQGNLKSAAKLIIKGASPSIRFHANSMLIIMLLLSSLAQVVAT